MTIGWPVRASAAQSGRSSSAAAKPVARMIAPLTPRMVAGMPAAARPAEGGGDAGEDAVGDVLGDQRQRLLRAAREDEGVAALQPHDLAAFLREAHQQRVDLVLRGSTAAAALADIEFLRAFRDGDDLVRNQRVMDQRVGLGQRRDHVERQAAGVAGAGAGQPDMAGLQLRQPVSRDARWRGRGSWRIRFRR